ncbi:MAG: hypothetical protein ABIP95_02335 [Pelobium sp.]
MAEINISTQNWDRLKIKLQRKYNHLSDEDLVFEAGQEEKLITHLQERLKRKREYVVFTLKKGLLNIENNRL